MDPQCNVFQISPRACKTPFLFKHISIVICILLNIVSVKTPHMFHFEWHLEASLQCTPCMFESSRPSRCFARCRDSQQRVPGASSRLLEKTGALIKAECRVCERVAQWGSGRHF